MGEAVIILLHLVASPDRSRQCDDLTVQSSLPNVIATRCKPVRSYYFLFSSTLPTNPVEKRFRYRLHRRGRGFQQENVAIASATLPPMPVFAV